MKLIRIIGRLFLGFLFIFSGFVKALDPLGSSYKFSDYFHAFGMDFLEVLALPLGIFLAAFEFVLGLVLILGYQKRITYWVLLVFMSFFTILTFILALTNPVTDCGCFGDAIIMTNWQTFFKNLVFMIFVLLLFSGRNVVRNVHRNLTERGLIVLMFAGVIFFSVACLRHLPVIDFRPYDVGTYIPDEMTIPEGAPVDEYETLLFYENLETGETEEFSIEDYPTDTMQYRFVTSESKLVSKGYEPPIHDFGLIAPSGEDVTDRMLANRGYTLLMVSYNIESADEKALVTGNDWNRLQQLADDFSFLPVTASGTELKNEISGALGLQYDFYAADEIMLKTVVRSNPGFVLLKHGTILAKWAYRDFPVVAEWSSEWPEMMDQFESEQDPEMLQLIAEGFMEPMQFDILDFDQVANKITALHHADRIDRMNWAMYALSVLLFLIVLQLIPSRKSGLRV